MIEAMRQALEHIEGNYTVSAEDAIKALRQAIAEAKKQEQGEPVGWIDSKGNMICTKINESCKPLYTTPQPKQEQGEPVGWIDSKGNMICTKINESCKPLYTTPQPNQEQGEPDDEVLGFNGWGFPIEPPPKPKQQQGEPATLEEIRKAMIFGIPLYTTPQQRNPVKFPTMLRKMWSGSEVQDWLDENVNKE